MSDDSGSTKAQQYEEKQSKFFTRYVNLLLSQKNIKIDDLRGFNDGINLRILLEVLEGSPIPLQPWTKLPKNKMQKVENIDGCLKFLKQKKVTVTCVPEDFVEGNLKHIMSFLWSVIVYYFIPGGRRGITEWVGEMLTKPHVKPNLTNPVTDFRTSWQDGFAFLGIMDAKEQGSVDWNQAKKNTQQENLLYAFTLAKERMQIPQVLELEDVQDPDERAIMTYLSLFREKKTPPPPALPAIDPAELAALKEMVKNLTTQLEERDAELNKMKELVQQMEEEKNTMKAENDKKDETLSTIRDDLAKKEAEAKLLRTEVDRRDELITSMKEKMFSATEVREEMEKRLDIALGELKDIHKELNNTREELDLIKTKSLAEVKYLTTSYREMQGQMVEYKNKNVEMEKKMEWMVSQIREYQKQNLENNDEANQLMNEIERLKRENDELQKKMKEMESKAKEAVSKANEMSKMFQNPKDSGKISPEAFEQAAADVAKLINDQQRFKEEVEALNLKNEQTMEYLRKLNDQLRTVMLQSEGIQKKYDDLAKLHAKCADPKDLVTIKKANEIVHSTKKKLELSSAQLRDMENEHMAIVQHLESLLEKGGYNKETWASAPASVATFVKNKRKLFLDTWKNDQLDDLDSNGKGSRSSTTLEKIEKQKKDKSEKVDKSEKADKMKRKKSNKDMARNISAPKLTGK